MWIKRGVTPLVVAGEPSTGSVQARPSTASPLPEGLVAGAQVEGIAEYRLANGLQLLLVPDDAKPSTTVNLTYRVGSRHENYGETGMAHLLEHLLFKGTPSYKNVWGEFTKRGLRANGSTWFDRTNYFASFAANPDNLFWYLSWQADAMLNSFIARADLDTEMTVVRNEMEMGENNPGRVLMDQTLATMYQWHNYGKSTIGARSDVENVDIDRLRAFYRQHYQPDNATLIVAGRFDVVQVRRWIAQLFGPLPKPSRPLPPTHTLDAAQDGERSVVLRRVGGTPMVYAAYHGVAASHPDFSALQLLSLMLGDAPAGRLHKALVEPQLAAAAFAFNFALAEPGPLLLGMQLAPGQDVDAARTALLSTLDDLPNQPFTPEELERARTQALNDWALGFTDPERVGVALSEAVSHGDWRLYFLARDRIRQLSLADVQRVANERLRRDNRTVALYQPTAQPERAPQPERVDLAAALEGYQGDAAAAPAEVFDATPANLDARTLRFDLPSGLRVAVLPKGTRGQVVQARLRLRFGDEASLRHQATVVAFMGSLFDKGGAGQTRQHINDRFDQLRAHVGFGAIGQALNVGITTTRDNLAPAVQLVAQLLRNPAFPAEVLEENRRQWLASIESQRKEPGAVASNALSRHGNPYPRGDLRYSPTFDEMVADVHSVTTDQIKALHQRMVSAAVGEFSAVGDIDLPALREVLAQSLGDWHAPALGPLPYARVPRPLVAVPPHRFVLTTPDKQNAHLLVRLALPINDTHPDYAALMAANLIFGAGGTSRLWIRIREREGLSYDVRSNVGWSNAEPNSNWSASAIFAPHNQAKVEAALSEELARSLHDGFTEQELHEARSSLLNQRRLSRAQDSAVAAALGENLMLGRNFSLTHRVDEAIAALTLEQVNSAWCRYIDPARMSMAWGGDFK